MTGPILREIVARYGDIVVMQILAAAQHLRARPNNSYPLAYYDEIVATRMSTFVKSVSALKDLVFVMRSALENSYSVKREHDGVGVGGLI